MSKSGKNGKKRIPRRVSTAPIFRAMFCASTEDVSDNDQTDIVLPAYAALDRLRAGQATPDDFVTINEFNVMTWTLGKQVAANRPDDTGETANIALQAKAVSEAGGEALRGIGERFISRDRLVATGDELTTIRASFNMGEELIRVLPRGLVLKAMIEAERMVSTELRRVAKRKAVA